MFSIFLAAGSALLDLHIKSRMEKKPVSYFPRKILGGHVLLRRHHNSGFCLNIGEDHPRTVLAIASCMMASSLAWFVKLLSRPGRWTEKTAAALIAGGAASNLTDRFRHGFVIDYFSFVHKKKPGKLILNLGDCFLMLGSGLMILSTIFTSDSEDSL